MTNILIISTFFPPNRLTPSERIYSWAKYFKKFGLFPIIVTRIWPSDVDGYESSALSSGSEKIIKRYDDYEVHFLPYENDFNERSALKWGKGKFHFLYRIILLINYFIEPIFLFQISSFYKSVYNYCKNLIKEKKITMVLISGAPFMLFKIGYILKKKNRSLQVYADYRDDWTTSEICFNPNKRKVMEVVRSYVRHFERKWLSVYNGFFTVSPHYVEKIQKLIKIPGCVAENGYLSENYNSTHLDLYKKFTITYIGYIYPTQPVEIFLKSVSRLIRNGYDIQVNFIGIKNQEDQYQRILNLTSGISRNVTLTGRVSKQECIDIQLKSHMLLQVGHQGIKGSPGSKMYEYLALRKPVLVCPSDQDIVEQTLTNSGQAIFANSVDECIQVLEHSYIHLREVNAQNLNEEFIKSFDREYIAQKMVNFIQMT